MVIVSKFCVLLVCLFPHPLARETGFSCFCLFSLSASVTGFLSSWSGISGPKRPPGSLSLCHSSDPTATNLSTFFSPLLILFTCSFYINCLEFLVVLSRRKSKTDVYYIFPETEVHTQTHTHTHTHTNANCSHFNIGSEIIIFTYPLLYLHLSHFSLLPLPHSLLSSTLSFFFFLILRLQEN